MIMPRTSRPFAVIGAAYVVLSLGACAGTPDPAQREVALRPGVERPTRSEAECSFAIDSVRAKQLAAKAPQPTQVFLPPPRPELERGNTFRFELFVDHRGMVQQDSTRISGPTSQSYLGTLRRMSEKMTFAPAVANGCAVPGWAVVTFTVAGRP